MATFATHDLERNSIQLKGPLAKQGYDWWWHNFTGRNVETGEEKSFFIEYFICNPELGRDYPVLGQSPENKEAGVLPSYLMVKAGHWGEGAKQLHRFFGWNDVRIKSAPPFVIVAEDCRVTETALQGSVRVSPEQAEDPGYMCDAGIMSWNLRVNKEIPFNVGYGAGNTFRKLNAFEMYWHAEGMKSTYQGTVVLDGQVHEVTPEISYGYADKNWGADFTTPWIWLSSWDMISNLTGERLENSVFDIGGGRPKAFGIGLNDILLGAFYYEGTPIEFNFSKFPSGAKTIFEAHETEDSLVWEIQQSNRQYLMRTYVTCPKSEMLMVNYEAPNGKKLHNRLWNGGTGVGNILLYKKGDHLNAAGLSKQETSHSVEIPGYTLIDDISVGHIGCEYGEFDKE